MLKNPAFTPYKLRANGSGVEIVEDFPFVLSLSKHVCAFITVSAATAFHFLFSHDDGN